MRYDHGIYSLLVGDIKLGRSVLKSWPRYQKLNRSLNGLFKKNRSLNVSVPFCFSSICGIPKSLPLFRMEVGQWITCVCLGFVFLVLTVRSLDLSNVSIMCAVFNLQNKNSCSYSSSFKIPLKVLEVYGKSCSHSSSFQAYHS